MENLEFIVQIFIFNAGLWAFVSPACVSYAVRRFCWRCIHNRHGSVRVVTSQCCARIAHTHFELHRQVCAHAELRFTDECRFMANEKLPPFLQQQVIDYYLYKWSVNRGLCLFSVVAS